MVDLTKYQVIFAICTVRSYYLILRPPAPSLYPPDLSTSAVVYSTLVFAQLISSTPLSTHRVSSAFASTRRRLRPIYSVCHRLFSSSSVRRWQSALLQRHLHFPHLPHRCHLPTTVVSPLPSYLRHYHISAPSSPALPISCLIYSASVSTASSLASPPPSLIPPLPPSPTVVQVNVY